MTADALSDRERQVALLKAEGTLQNKEIAQRLRLHPNTVTNILKRPAVQELIRATQEQAVDEAIVNLHAAFNDAAAEAYRTLTYLAKHAKSEQVRLKAAAEILDRAGDAPKRQLHGQAHQQTHISMNYISVEQLRLIEETRRQIYHRQREQGKAPEGACAPKPLAIPDGAAKLAFYTDAKALKLLGSRFVDADGRPIRAE